jgi:hypothetical protein
MGRRSTTCLPDRSPPAALGLRQSPPVPGRYPGAESLAFNSYGACPACQGLGVRSEVVPYKSLTGRERDIVLHGPPRAAEGDAALAPERADCTALGEL